MQRILVYVNSEETQIEVEADVWREYYVFADSHMSRSQQLLLSIDGHRLDAHNYRFILSMMTDPQRPVDTGASRKWYAMGPLTLENLGVSAWINMYVMPKKRSYAMDGYLWRLKRKALCYYDIFSILMSGSVRGLLYQHGPVQRCGDIITRKHIVEALNWLMTVDGATTSADAFSTRMSPNLPAAPDDVDAEDFITSARMQLVEIKPTLLKIDGLGLEGTGEVVRLLTEMMGDNYNHGFISVLKNGIDAIRFDV